MSLKNSNIQIILSYLIILILFILVLYGLPRYIAWNKIYFAKVNKQIENLNQPKRDIIIRNANETS